MRLSNPTNRNTRAALLELGPHEVFFSYETPIAYRGPAYPNGVRRPNDWGPTTGRHFRELGCAEFGGLEPEAFLAELERIFATPPKGAAYNIITGELS
jgi:hypothetical protein